jgi:hypothetical protein
MDVPVWEAKIMSDTPEKSNLAFGKVLLDGTTDGTKYFFTGNSLL